MEKIEEYISRRKKEDAIDEFNLEVREENHQLVKGYVKDYFYRYLNHEQIKKNERQINESLKRFDNEIKKYGISLQKWLLNIYQESGQHFHKKIINQIKKDRMFLLNHTESDFVNSTNKVYDNLLPEHKWLEGNQNMLLKLIENHHFIKSSKKISEFILNEKITDWTHDTWDKYNVNLIVFVEDYINWFSSDESYWDAAHKVIGNDNTVEYNYKVNCNLFNLNTLYKEISDKPFLKNKKKYLEKLMMYEWLHSIVADNNYWIQYYQNLSRQK